MNAADVVGYTFAAAVYHPECVLVVLKNEGMTEQAAGDVERGLDRLAQEQGIEDRMDESSFDSDEFPKAIFASQVADETEVCEYCEEPLLED